MPKRKLPSGGSSSIISFWLQLHYAQAETAPQHAQRNAAKMVATSLCPSGNQDKVAKRGCKPRVATSLCPSGNIAAEVVFNRNFRVATSLCPSGNDKSARLEKGHIQVATSLCPSGNLPGYELSRNRGMQVATSLCPSGNLRRTTRISTRFTLQLHYAQAETVVY